MLERAITASRSEPPQGVLGGSGASPHGRRAGGTRRGRECAGATDATMPRLAAGTSTLAPAPSATCAFPEVGANLLDRVGIGGRPESAGPTHDGSRRAPNPPPHPGSDRWTESWPAHAGPMENAGPRRTGKSASERPGAWCQRRGVGGVGLHPNGSLNHRDENPAEVVCSLLQGGILHSATSEKGDAKERKGPTAAAWMRISWSRDGALRQKQGMKAPELPSGCAGQAYRTDRRSTPPVVNDDVCPLRYSACPGLRWLGNGPTPGACGPHNKRAQLWLANPGRRVKLAAWQTS